ncbi:MAG: hypothetical protein HRU19_07430 [Pseudobacteriovorax sp.]|nr:hypothetical protein [Pseudobacteriovorax sp.]
MEDKWLSIVEYARTYDISDMTVRRRIKTGKLNAELRDGKYFINASLEKPKSRFDATETTTKLPIVESRKPLPESQSLDIVGASHFEERLEQPKPSPKTLRDHEVVNKIDEILLICKSKSDQYKKNEQYLRMSFSNKVLHLEQTIKTKDMEIAALKQQVEDLEILLRMYDQKTIQK